MSSYGNFQKTATSNSGVSVLSFLRIILASRKYRVLAVASGLGYWLLYAFSGGMIFYYSFDVIPFLKFYALPNPYSVNYFRSLAGFYYSGMIWYPNGHLQINLLYGPTFFSVILSTLFGLNMMLFGYGLSVRTKSSLGLNGFAGIVPALFSGGCCAVPFGSILLSSFVPLPVLSTFIYGYVLEINSLFAILMLLTLLYAARRVGSCCNSQLTTG